jgi:hypothetical protein
MVKGLIIENGKVKGIRTLLDWDWSKSVVLTNGTLEWFDSYWKNNLEEEEQARVLRMELPKI